MNIARSVTTYLFLRPVPTTIYLGVFLVFGVIGAIMEGLTLPFIFVQLFAGLTGLLALKTTFFEVFYEKLDTKCDVGIGIKISTTSVLFLLCAVLSFFLLNAKITY